MEHCKCGWELPESVLPVTVASISIEGDNESAELIPAACVRLVCPRCGWGHLFFHPEAAKAAGILTEGGDS